MRILMYGKELMELRKLEPAIEPENTPCFIPDPRVNKVVVSKVSDLESEIDHVPQTSVEPLGEDEVIVVGGDSWSQYYDDASSVIVSGIHRSAAELEVDRAAISSASRM